MDTGTRSYNILRKHPLGVYNFDLDGKNDRNYFDAIPTVNVLE